MTIDELREGLVRHDGGLLKYGSHRVDAREYCPLEFSSIMRGQSFSDRPGDLPDLLELSDAFGADDQMRTDHILPVIAALWEWREWSPSRQQQWVECVAIAIVREIVVTLPCLTESIRWQCREATTLQKAEAAADAAEAAANHAEAWATSAAADAAAWAVWTTRSAGHTAAGVARATRAAGNAVARAAGAALAAGDAEARAKILSHACAMWVRAAETTALAVLS